MAVLQFGFTPSERHTQHVPAEHEEDQVVYTGTHDNDTIRGWYDGLPPQSLALVERVAARVRDRGARAALGDDPPGLRLPGARSR